jgi:hypothetical protein
MCAEEAEAGLGATGPFKALGVPSGNSMPVAVGGNRSESGDDCSFLVSSGDSVTLDVSSLR